MLRCPSSLLPALVSLTVTCGADWNTVTVPGSQEFRGYGWYRAWLKPHPSFFSQHERDLFGESVVLNIRGLTGAHAAYVNGTKIGTGGSFPPEYRDGSDGNHRHKIPSGTLVADQWNELVIQVYHESDQGGFQTEPPFVMNYFWECVLAGSWEFHSGETPKFSGQPLESRPELAAFQEFQQSNRVLGEAEKLFHGDKLSPHDSFSKMSTADDLTLELMLSEPLVAQPTHFSFDSRGRLWVSQYRQYPYPAGVKMISRDRYYRSHYDRTPPAPPQHDHGRDVVSIHEDTDGDGEYDRHKVFQDGLNMANAAVRGRGGVWVMHTPYLLYYPDRDFDDVPDGPPEVHLQGFGLEDTHSVANGLVWGMDGWLYGAQGSTTSCHVTRPGIDAADAPGVYFQGCMVWRYHPESRRFEIFAEGGGNNFGLEVDSAGRLFTGHNGGETRGWHYLQGGQHLMQGTTPDKFGPPRNPFAFGELPMMASVQEIPRFTHFATVVESTAMPRQYQQSLFSVEPLHNFVIASRRIPRGATFKTDDMVKVLTSADFAFRPVYIGNAPDGSVFVADFYEHYIAHGQHYQSQIDPTTGRIYRLRGTNCRLETDINLHAKSVAQWVELLSHPNRWHRHTAVRLLGERKDLATKSSLQDLIRDRDGLTALAALWALYQAFGLDDDSALAALQHAYPPVRYWAVRLSCDDIGFAHPRSTVGLISSLGQFSEGPTRLSDRVMERLCEQAQREVDAEVRSQMAASARRLPPDQALAILQVLVGHEQDIDDPYIPLLCWWVIEANLDRSREAVMQFFEDPGMLRQPLVVNHLLSRMMRGLALKGKRRDLQDCARLLAFVNQRDDQGTEPLDQVLSGFEQAYAGRNVTGLPAELARALVENGRASLNLRIRLGDPQAIEEGLALLNHRGTEPNQRIALARVLGELVIESADAPLRELAVNGEDPSLQRAALTALSNFADPGIGSQMLDHFTKLPLALRPAFFDLMLSRAAWTEQLMDALAAGTVDPQLIPADVVDQLRAHGDVSIAAVAGQMFGPGSVLDADQVKAQIVQVRQILGDGSGNPYAGEAIFVERCAACHKLFHKGGNVGPDLTPYQRGDLDTLLTSIVDPSAEIREGFENSLVLTSDGRIVSGFVIDHDNQIVTVRVKSGEDVRIQLDQVESISPAGRSLMPHGLLDGLADQELRDFFAYLRISQPISN